MDQAGRVMIKESEKLKNETRHRKRVVQRLNNVEIPFSQFFFNKKINVKIKHIDIYN